MAEHDNTVDTTGSDVDRTAVIYGRASPAIRRTIDRWMAASLASTGAQHEYDDGGKRFRWSINSMKPDGSVTGSTLAEGRKTGFKILRDGRCERGTSWLRLHSVGNPEESTEDQDLNLLKAFTGEPVDLVRRHPDAVGRLLSQVLPPGVYRLAATERELLAVVCALSGREPVHLQDWTQLSDNVLALGSDAKSARDSAWTARKLGASVVATYALVPLGEI